MCFPSLGELQRKIGLKVLEMGGNAVVGYLQCFDLEGESGLVVRAIGTACTLEKLSSGSAPSTTTHTHPNTAPASNACNSPSKDGKEWVWTKYASMQPASFCCKSFCTSTLCKWGKFVSVCMRGENMWINCPVCLMLYSSSYSCVCLGISDSLS